MAVYCLGALSATRATPAKSVTATAVIVQRRRMNMST